MALFCRLSKRLIVVLEEGRQITGQCSKMERTIVRYRTLLLLVLPTREEMKIVVFITFLFSLTHGIFTDILKIRKVTPIYKKAVEKTLKNFVQSLHCLSKGKKSCIKYVYITHPICTFK